MVIKYIRKLLGVKSKVKAEVANEAPPAPPPRPHQPEIHHRPIPRNLIDQDAAKIVMRLTRFGHSAYIVGGGVRDLLLHRTPKDFDIGTSARPNEVRKLFRNCRIIGRRFRLAHIFFHDKIIEVATYRSNEPEDLAAAAAAEVAAAQREAAGEPVRTDRQLAPPDEGDLLIRSDNVFGTPETDALRRDFTINALFYDLETGNVIDYVRGIPDLDAHLLRTIGDPDVRLREDPIRILRAIRLAGRLGFDIDPATVDAIKRHKNDIHRAASPRILEDVLRMLRGSGARAGFTLLRDLEIETVLLPELTKATRPGDLDVQAKILHALDLATARGTEFSNATLLSLLYYPFVTRALDHGDADGGNAALAAIDRIVGGFEQRLIVPKRDRDRVRQILTAQRRFLPAQGGKRFSASGFVRKPFFPEAFDLFDIVASGTGEHRDEVRRWKSRINSVAVATDGDAIGPEIPHGPVHTDAQAERGRRRRGGRGRGGVRGRSDHERAEQAPGHQPQATHHEAVPHEPISIPELAPGENPYGDAIAVPLDGGRSRQPGGSHRSSHAGHTATHNASHGSGRSAAAASGAEVRTGKPGHGIPDDKPGAAGDLEGKPGPAGGRRRRRRGGRGRKRGGGGGGQSGAGDAGGNAPPSSDL